MTGIIWINLGVGAFGFLITYVTALGNNLPGTSLVRGLMGFALWFMLAFIPRWVLGFIGKTNDPHREEADSLGAHLDISTPDEEDELKDLLRPGPPASDDAAEGGFQPLRPPKLVTAKDPEELAKAVRQLKEE